MYVKSRHLSVPTIFLLISVVPKFDLSYHIIHLPVIQTFYDFFSSQSIARNNFFYTVFFFFFSIFTSIPLHRHNDILHPENLFLLTLTFLILMENKPNSHYIRVLWDSEKGTWMKYKRYRTMNLGKPFYFSEPYFYYL